MFWTDESLSRVDSSAYFMQRYPSDLGPLILIWIIQEDRTLNFWYLVCSLQCEYNLRRHKQRFGKIAIIERIK